VAPVRPENTIAATRHCSIAMTSSGGSQAAERAKIAPAIFWQVMLRAPTAAGKRGLTTSPRAR